MRLTGMAIACDPRLVAGLLHISAIHNIAPVTSIQHALQALGSNRVIGWLSALSKARTVNEQPCHTAATMSLASARARMMSGLMGMTSMCDTGIPCRIYIYAARDTRLRR